MGFLDFLDNPGLMNNLLGGSNFMPPPTPAAAYGGMPVGQPPPIDPSQAPAPAFNRTETPIVSPNPAAMQDPTIAAGGPGAGAGPPMVPSVGGPPIAAPGTPMPPPDPRLANAQVAASPGAPISLSPNGPNTGAPTMPPPANPNIAPPVSTTGGGLHGAFGLNPNQWRSTMMGLGSGLSAVGRLRPGASAGQAIAAGLGGSLEGTGKAQMAQQAQTFNQSSTYFKDMLAAKNSNDTEAYRTAQAKYLQARALSIMQGGNANGTRAWQNTDYGKTIQVENEAQKYEKGQQILLQKQWAMNGSSPEQQQKDLDNLNKNVDGYRQRLYKQAGVDPSKAAKLKDMGTTADNPFDTKGMTVDQFHQQVPMGGWYKTDKGIFQRTVPPPGVNQQQQGANYYDDMNAMQPAA